MPDGTLITRISAYFIMDPDHKKESCDVKRRDPMTNWALIGGHILADIFAVQILAMRINAPF